MTAAISDTVNITTAQGIQIDTGLDGCYLHRYCGQFIRRATETIHSGLNVVFCFRHVARSHHHCSRALKTCGERSKAVKKCSVLQTVAFTMPTRPVRCIRYCLTQWISELPGSNAPVTSHSRAVQWPFWTKIVRPHTGPVRILPPRTGPVEF